MKVESQTSPAPISMHGTQAWLRTNITPVERTSGMDEGTWHGFEYDEIVVEGYSERYVEKHFDDIFANPDNYNVIVENGKRVKRPLGQAYAHQQELDELWQMDAVVDQLVVDSLEGLL